MSQEMGNGYLVSGQEAADSWQQKDRGRRSEVRSQKHSNTSVTVPSRRDLREEKINCLAGRRTSP